MNRYNNPNPYEVRMLQLELLSHIFVGLDWPIPVMDGSIKLIHLKQKIEFRISSAIRKKNER